MATEHHFSMDTAATRHDLLDTLIQAGLGFGRTPGSDQGALTLTTDVTVLDDLGSRRFRPDNGVVSTRSLTFRDRRPELHAPADAAPFPYFETETVRGIVALLRAYPEADASWEAYDDRTPLLLRRRGRLVLSQGAARPSHFWDPARSSALPWVTLPYTFEALGPWELIESRS